MGDNGLKGRLRDGVLRSAAPVLKSLTRVRRPRGRLLTIMLHTLSETMDEALEGPLDPFQPFTVDDLDTMITEIKAYGFRFVLPSAIDDAGGDDALAILTFDDGYYNNHLALPVLHKHDAPAVLFASTGHIASGRAFWWDALWRAGRDAGMSRNDVVQLGERLKRLSHWSMIEAAVSERFGLQVFDTVSDVDRPMTVDELRAFAGDPLIEIGNHTHDHAILSRHSDSEIDAQIGTGQEHLTSWFGQAPTAIAYPNGGFDGRCVETARRHGLSVGFSVEAGIEALPVTTDRRRMSLRRFAPDGRRSIESQLARIRIARPQHMAAAEQG